MKAKEDRMRLLFQRAVVLDGWMRPLDADVYERVEQPVSVQPCFSRIRKIF